MTAKGPPNERGKFVTIMKIGPRRFKVCSFAASDAEVEDAGYSPKKMLRNLLGNTVALRFWGLTSSPKSNYSSGYLIRIQHRS